MVRTVEELLWFSYCCTILWTTSFVTGRLAGLAMWKLSPPPLNLGVGPQLFTFHFKEAGVVTLRLIPLCIWLTEPGDRWTMATAHKLPSKISETESRKARGRVFSLVTGAATIPFIALAASFVLLQVLPSPITRVRVTCVYEDSPASRVGLKVGDLLVSIGSRKVLDAWQGLRMLAAHRGKETTLVVRRSKDPSHPFGEYQLLKLSITPYTLQESAGLIGISWSPIEVPGESYRLLFIDALKETIGWFSERKDVINQRVSYFDGDDRHPVSFRCWHFNVGLYVQLSFRVCFIIFLVPLPYFPIHTIAFELIRLMAARRARSVVSPR